MFGISTSAFAWQPFFYGTDNFVIRKNSDDIPYFDYTNERVTSALIRVIELLNDRQAMHNVNHAGNIASPDRGQAVLDIFMQDRALFFTEVLYGTIPLRAMESDYGILPNPKFNELQENHTTFLLVGNTSAMMVPITNNDLTNTGKILEDMAHQSSLFVKPAYYDITLTQKSIRDEDSAEMLDIIHSNISLDLALVMRDYGINVDGFMRGAATEHNTAIVSEFEARSGEYNAILDSIVEIFSK
jgi:hypothetical protein